VAGAFSIYAAFSFLAFGLRPLLHPGTDYIGVGEDPQIFIWSFAWWPHAILHGLNPFVTHAIWSPDGVNLTWATSVPGLALLFAPLTLTLGPFAAYNVAAVLMPALAAWTAFLLCRRLTGRFWPSLFGGYLFGFSSYLIGHEEGHMHATSVFLIPIVALLGVRSLQGDLTRRGLATRLAPVFAGQILFSTEVAFTLAVAIASAFGVAYWQLKRHRERLRGIVAPAAWAAAGAALLVSPFLYFAVTGVETTSINSPEDFPADLLNLVVPTKLALVGAGWAGHIADVFPGNNSERGAYLGVPFLVMLALFLRTRWSRPSARALAVTFAVATVAALGPTLVVHGERIVPLPSRLVASLPFFNNVLPGRLTVYAALAAAMIGAIWTSTSTSRRLRLALPMLSVIAIAPNPWSGAFSESYAVPRFFTDPMYRSCLKPGERILPLPIGSNGIPMLWQVAADFRFDMAGGRILPQPPSSFHNPDLIVRISDGFPVKAEEAAQFVAFIEAKKVTSVVVDERQASKWTAALDRLAEPHRFGGIVLYTFGREGGSCLGGSSTIPR